MDLKTLTSAIMEVTEERGIPEKQVVKIIQSALASAYKKEYGQKKEKYKAKMNRKTGEVKFWQVKKVVNEDMILSEEEIEKLKKGKKEKDEDKVKFIPERHIMLEEAKELDEDAEVGGFVKIPVRSREGFGRIAAQTAKQVILQKIKEAEKDIVFNEYKEKEGEIVSGIVQRIEKGTVYFDIGKTTGILPRSEQIRGEHYASGQRFKLYLLKVEDNSKGPVIFLSRAYPKLVSKLFELEVPEISAEQVEIKSIAREAGSRTKIAVYAPEEEIDAVGSMVGQKGTRILAVINELGGEKVDVIEWSEDEKEYITNALRPAEVLDVEILPKNKARAIVAEEQLSLAIGKEGQNVRLAAKLTGWKIDVKSIEQIEEEKEGKGKKKKEKEDKKEKKDKDEKKEEEEDTEEESKEEKSEESEE